MNNPNATKECERCKACKPETTEFFSLTRGGRLMNVCKACRWPVQDAPAAGQRRCTKCSTVHPETLEFFQPRRTRGRVGFQSWCRVCQGQATAKWEEAHPGNGAARTARHRAANPELHRAKDREARRKMRAADPNGEQQKRKAWAQANPEKVQAARIKRYHNGEKFKILNRNRNRRALKKGSAGQHTAEDVQQIIAAQHERCFYCQSELDFNAARAVQVDHFIPLTRGGQNGPDNIVVACASCNGSKNDRMPWEWMPDRFLPPAPIP